MTELIAASGKHWVSEIESSRLILWQGQWQRVDGIAQAWRQEHPESFRANVVTGRNGQQRDIWAFTQTVQWKKYGSKRLVIIHETADLSDTPRFLLTDALHWDSSRTFDIWSDRWPIQTFHEFAKQVVGFLPKGDASANESAQLRQEEAVKRHVCLSCVAHAGFRAFIGTV